MKIINREPQGIQKVYDLTIPETENFVLENGTIVHNCFNKAHSVSYSMLTYITGFLKTHYPLEFFASLMTVRSQTLMPKNWALKAHEYVKEANLLGVKVNPPSVNNSNFEFTINNNEIYFGLNAIRDVGKAASRSIIKTREKKEFIDIYDFVSRINLQKVSIKTFTSLVNAGCFDCLGYRRSDLLLNGDNLYSYIKEKKEYHQRLIDISIRNEENEKTIKLQERRDKKRKVLKEVQKRLKKSPSDIYILEEERKAQELLGPFEEMELRKKPTLKEKPYPSKVDFTRVNQVDLSLKETIQQAHYIGCFIGTHPLDYLDTRGYHLISNVEENVWCEIFCLIVSFKEITTRKGDKMAILEVDDRTASGEIVLFPRIWKKYRHLNLKDGDIVSCSIKTEQINPDIKMIGTDLTLIKTTEED